FISRPPLHRSPGHLRRGAAMVFLPDEARSLPPPPLLNKGSVWLGFVGWLSALADNAFNQRPVLRAGTGDGINQTCTTEGEIMEIGNHRFYSCNFTVVLSIPAKCLLHVGSKISFRKQAEQVKKE
uniref:Uncharacterized protein n=1 Tax=Cyanoderma ruficeps TaxID=181631 RepID=A0A8C3R8E2_9PASS